MKRRSQKWKIIVLIGFSVAILFIAYFLLPPSPDKPVSPDRSVFRMPVETVSDIKDLAERAILLKKVGELNEQEIAFYGRVIDQDGNPVAKAKIGGATLYNDMLSHGKRDYDAMSDANGNFVFPSIKGKDFSCAPRKDGYIYHAATGYIGYVLSQLAPMSERFVSNPAKPEIFRMWKIKGSEILLCDGSAFYLPASGELTFLDLKTGKHSSETGDIAFWCYYTVLPKDTSSEDRKIGWTFGVKVAGGGVIPTLNSLPYEAPTAGYEEEWRLYTDEASRTSRGMGGNGITFYFKTRNQEFGVINVHVLFDPIDLASPVDCGWKINPSGSRNLEPGKEQPLKRKSNAKPGMTLQHLRQNKGR